MDESLRRELTDYFNYPINRLTLHQLERYDQLIDEHVTECIEIRAYIKTEQIKRRDNGNRGPG